MDFLFRNERLIVETDGGPYHRSLIAQEADRGKQAALEAAGYRVLRISDDEIEHPLAVERLRRALRSA